MMKVLRHSVPCAHRAVQQLSERLVSVLTPSRSYARARPTAAFSAAVDVGSPASSSSDFLAPQSVTFESLGVSEELIDALQRAGYIRPAHVQAAAVPRALAGKDFILAAETGSGKTLAYLIPVMQSLRTRKLQIAADRPTAPAWFHHCAVVFCPNLALCEQVVATAAALTDENGAALASCQIVSTRQPPGSAPIDIVVSTPAALVNMLLELGSAYGREWSPEALSQRVRHLVADEADMLVTNPAYWDPMSKFLDLLRGGERAFAARAVCTTTGMAMHEFEELQRAYKHAAYRNGVEGMVRAGWEPSATLPVATEDNPVASVPRDLWVGAPHRCRSYLFVAATMPREGGKSAAQDLARRFPDMEWIQGSQLHHSKSEVAHEFIPLASADEVAPTVIRVLQEDRVVTERVGHVLVFCQDTSSATALHTMLEAVGLRALLYHKHVPEKERTRALKLLREEEGWVLVCTDVAARGLDIVSVHHVIQADFALNAIDFLHRIGRTARAGRTGKVTSLYTPSRAHLAETIQQAVARGDAVEGAFSRNRSFSKKYEKYGQYVPRGQTSGAGGPELVSSVFESDAGVDV